jgi:hypothetical protein
VSTRTDTEVREYLDRLRHELAGLPAGEIDEILQDVEPQLVAIAAEEPPSASAQSSARSSAQSATLADRLGDPGEYARELRAAMGVPDETTAPASRLPRIALWTLVTATVATGVAGHVIGRVTANAPRPALVFLAVALAASWFAVGRSRSAVAGIAELPEVRAVTTRLPDRSLPAVAYLAFLRPGWLLVRAALACLGALWLLGWFGWQSAGAAVPALAAAVLTVVVGHRAARDRRWLWLSAPLDAWAIGVAVKAMEALPLLAAGDHAWP